MKERRISYRWLNDLIFTFLNATLIITVFILSMYLIDIPIKNETEFILVMYLFVGPLFSIIIGLRPIIGLRTTLNTLYCLSDHRISIDKLTEFEISNIKTVSIKQIGILTSHMHYYEIELFNIPNELKQNLKNRNTLICSERYYLKNIFGTRTILLHDLLKIGLERKKINRHKITIKNIFGYKDKFK
jgi:hypothetical protein